MADFIAALEALPRNAKTTVLTLADDLACRMHPEAGSHFFTPDDERITETLAARMRQPARQYRQEFRAAIVDAVWPEASKEDRARMLSESVSDELLSTHLARAAAVAHSLPPSTPRLTALDVAALMNASLRDQLSIDECADDADLERLAQRCERYVDAAREARQVAHERRMRNSDWLLAAPATGVAALLGVWVFGGRSVLLPTVALLLAIATATGGWYLWKQRLRRETSHLAVSGGELASSIVYLAVRAHPVEFTHLSGRPVAGPSVEDELASQLADDTALGNARRRLATTSTARDAAQTTLNYWEDLQRDAPARIEEADSAIRSAQMRLRQHEEILDDVAREMPSCTAEEQRHLRDVDVHSMRSPDELRLSTQIGHLEESCRTMAIDVQRHQDYLRAAVEKDPPDEGARQRADANLTQVRSALSRHKAELDGAKAGLQECIAQRTRLRESAERRLQDAKGRLEALRARRQAATAGASKERAIIQHKSEHVTELRRELDRAPDEARNAAAHLAECTASHAAAQVRLDELCTTRAAVVERAWAKCIPDAAFVPDVISAVAGMGAQERLGIELIVHELALATDPLDLVATRNSGSAIIDTPIGRVGYSYADAALTITSAATVQGGA